MLTFNDYRIQTFSVPKPILNFLLDNLNGEILKKLHKSCKYFYVKMPYAIFDFLLINNMRRKMQMREYEGFFPSNDPFLKESGKNVWLAEELIFQDFEGLINISTIISKIVRCDISQLNLRCPVTFEELKFLTKSGNIETLIMYGEEVFYPKDALIPPEDIFPLVPNATFINIHQVTVTKNTIQKLLKHEHQVKIKDILLSYIDAVIEANLICKFFEQNLDMKPHIFINFKDENYNEIFQAEVCEILRSWTPKEKIPENFPNLFTRFY